MDVSDAYQKALAVDKIRIIKEFQSVRKKDVEILDLKVSLSIIFYIFKCMNMQKTLKLLKQLIKLKSGKYVLQFMTTWGSSIHLFYFSL